MAALALEFLILTAACSDEVLGATWIEVDMNAALRVVAAALTRPARTRRVPLPSDVLTLLRIVEPLRQANGAGFVFPSQREGQPLSGTAMPTVLHRMKIAHARADGFSSNFREPGPCCGPRCRSRPLRTHPSRLVSGRGVSPRQCRHVGGNPGRAVGVAVGHFPARNASGAPSTLFGSAPALSRSRLYCFAPRAGHPWEYPLRGGRVRKRASAV